MRLVHHSTHIHQERAQEAASMTQDEAFFDAQLLRAISLALTSVGFDSVKPTALEAFRGEVEQYILHFLASVRSSMISNRRSQPVPQDFVTALSQFGVTPHDLLPHIQLPLAPHITQPPLPSSLPDEPPPPPTNSILGPELTGVSIRRKYMPRHLPDLPSRHTWKDTAIYTNRETDARKIRELATEEGVLAERAMRKLMASASLTKPTNGGRQSQKDQMMWEQTLEAIIQMDQNQTPTEDEIEWPGEAHTAASFDSAIPVNYDRRYWRKAAQGS